MTSITLTAAATGRGSMMSMRMLRGGKSAFSFLSRPTATAGGGTNGSNGNCIMNRGHRYHHHHQLLPRVATSAPTGIQRYHYHRCGRDGMTRTTVTTTTTMRGRSMVTVTKTVSPTKQTTPIDDDDSNVVTVGQGTNSTNNNNDNNNDNDNDENIINITESCVQRIKQLISKKPADSNYYLRVYVDAGGCSGFQYKFELESDTDNDNHEEEGGGGIDPQDDVVFEKNGARVVIDSASLGLIRGGTVDYAREMIRSSFVVTDNPQSESACGCGSSFAVKNFEANPALD